MLYHFRAATYDIGLRVADAWGSIVCPLHLYTALQQEKLLSPGQSPAEPWEDMDVVLALLGEDSFYVGGELPKTPRDYLKKFYLQLGATAAAFTNSKQKRIRKFEDLFSRGGPRSIKKDCAPVSDMFADRYLHNTGQVDWTPEHVDSVISRSLYEEGGPEEEVTLLLGQIEDPYKLRQRKKNINAGAGGGRRGKKTAEGARMPPDRLIRALVLGLQAESPTLAFPYLALHRAAWGVLGALREACEPLLVEPYGPACIKKEYQLPWVVGWAFEELVQGDARLLVKTGEALRDQ